MQSPALANQLKPAIFQCFGDIAQAIGGNFEAYLSVIAGNVLQQAAAIKVPADAPPNFEYLDYILSLREGVMDAWGGIILAMRSGNKGTPPVRCSSNHANYFDSTTLAALC